MQPLIVGVASVALAAGAGFAGFGGLGFGDADTIVVTPDNMQEEQWFFYNDENDTVDDSLGSFVNGPDTPPKGTGSVEIDVSGTQRRNLATIQFSGTELDDITEWKYSTYNPSAGNGGDVTRSAYMNFNVDFDGSDTWQRRLAFVPRQNGTVVQDSWQEWDLINGGNALWWWSGYASNGNQWPDGNTNEYRTWNDLITSFPGIRIRVTDAFVGLRVGEPYSDGYTENIDKFVFNTGSDKKTFDFELEESPEDKDECKKDGWKQFDKGFKNQGHCVRSIPHRSKFFYFKNPFERWEDKRDNDRRNTRNWHWDKNDFKQDREDRRGRWGDFNRDER